MIEKDFIWFLPLSMKYFVANAKYTIIPTLQIRNITASLYFFNREDLLRACLCGASLDFLELMLGS